MTTVIFSHGQGERAHGAPRFAPWPSWCAAWAVRPIVSITRESPTRPNAVEKCVRECADISDQLVLVGSSMGGHVATAAAEQVGAAGLFVLAPAYYMERL